VAWITPKTDWAVSDYYNYADLNRVENNTDYLADYIATFAAHPSLTSIKTDWAKTDLVFKAVLNKVENNIAALRSTLAATPTGWITLVTDWESLDKFDYIDANRLETDLVLLKQMAENITAALLNCGNFICGEGTEL
jgi:hypothetical protein